MAGTVDVGSWRRVLVELYTGWRRVSECRMWKGGGEEDGREGGRRE